MTESIESVRGRVTGGFRANGAHSAFGASGTPGDTGGATRSRTLSYRLRRALSAFAVAALLAFVAVSAAALISTRSSTSDLP